jgi:hypothetical protein
MFNPPVDFAFLGLYKLLKPGGWLIFSVPHTRAGSPHIEHFPVMVNSSLIVGDTPMLRGTDTEGNVRRLGIIWEPWSRVWVAQKPFT